MRPPADVFETNLTAVFSAGSTGSASVAISAVTGISSLGSSMRLVGCAVVRARNSFFAAAIELASAASVDKLFRLASGDDLTYRRNAADDHLPKIWTLHRSTPALARWCAPEARAVCPENFGAPFSQVVSKPRVSATLVKVVHQPRLDDIPPNAVGNSHPCAFPSTDTANAIWAAMAWKGHRYSEPTLHEHECALEVPNARGSDFEFGSSSETSFFTQSVLTWPTFAWLTSTSLSNHQAAMRHARPGHSGPSASNDARIRRVARASSSNGSACLDGPMLRLALLTAILAACLSWSDHGCPASICFRLAASR